jgi:hypothetical protein
MQSKLGAIGAILYLLAFACAYAYPFFVHETFAGIFMVLLALPWIDYVSGGWLWGAVALNALIIYFVLALLSLLPSLLLRSRT